MLFKNFKFESVSVESLIFNDVNDLLDNIGKNEKFYPATVIYENGFANVFDNIVDALKTVEECQKYDKKVELLIHNLEISANGIIITTNSYK